jgi:hypothetical protein
MFQDFDLVVPDGVVLLVAQRYRQDVKDMNNYKTC